MSEFDDIKNLLGKSIRLMGGELDKLEEDAKDSNLDTKSVWSLTTISKTLLSIYKQSKETPDEEEDFSNLTPEELDALAKQTLENMKKDLQK